MVLKNVDTVNYDRPNLTGTDPKISCLLHEFTTYLQHIA